MKMPIKPSVTVEDGLHNGTITAVEYRTDPYNYTDVLIELKGGVTVKSGYPSLITPTSRLGKLLTRFGMPLVVGREADPDSLIGRETTFQTTTEERAGSKYCKVLPESVGQRKKPQAPEPLQAEAVKAEEPAGELPPPQTPPPQ